MISRSVYGNPKKTVLFETELEELEERYRAASLILYEKWKTLPEGDQRKHVIISLVGTKLGMAVHV